MRKIIMIGLGFIATGLGFMGVFMPVIPTTPFLLLAAFLFSRSSERFNTWLQGTKMYAAYVEPFKRDGGISKKKKVQILCTTYGVMFISGLIVRKWQPIVFMALAAVCLFWYIWFHMKTVEEETENSISKEE